MGLTALLAAQRDIVIAKHAATYKGRSLLNAPRTDPSEPNSGTRLLPRVSDGKAHTGPGMKDPRSGEKLVDQLRHARPHQVCLLTAPAEAAVPEDGDMVVERADRRAIRRHGVVGEIPGDDLPKPFPGVRDRQVPSLSQLFLIFRSLARMRSRRDFLLIWNSPRRDLPQISTK